jgi:hypothetical protein
VIFGPQHHAFRNRRALLHQPDPGHQYPQHGREDAEEPGGTGQPGQAEREHDPAHPGRQDPAHHDARSVPPGRRRARWTSGKAPGWIGCGGRWRSLPAQASDAAPLLLKAARRFEPLDLDLARETFLDAWQAAQIAGHPAPVPAAAATLGWELLDEDGVVVAVATATVQIRSGMLREPAAED